MVQCGHTHKDTATCSRGKSVNFCFCVLYFGISVSELGQLCNKIWKALKKKFIAFDCARSSLLLGLFFSCGERGLLSSCGAWASHCSGLPCGNRLQVPWLPGSRAQAQWLWRMGQLFRGMWDLPGSGIKPRGQANSSPLSHWGRPSIVFYFYFLNAMDGLCKLRNYLCVDYWWEHCGSDTLLGDNSLTVIFPFTTFLH